MPIAHALFESSTGIFSSDVDRIDLANGILKGVKLLELGKLATFTVVHPDGRKEVRQTVVKPAHIEALLKLTANKTTSSHWTHDYHGQVDPLNAQIGGVANTRSLNGSPIGDLMLAPGPIRDKALWFAANMPEKMMISPLYHFEPTDPDCVPTSIQAFDIVEAGAGTTSLWSESQHQPTAKMAITIEELKPLLDDPKVKEMIKGCIDGHSDAEDAEMEDAQAGEMENAAGVTDDDKKDDAKQTPALMAAVAAKKPGARFRLAQVRMARANARMAKAQTGGITAAELKVALDARETESLGKTKALFSTAGFTTGGEDGEAFIDAQIKAGCKNRATAIMRMAKDKPELYATFR